MTRKATRPGPPQRHESVLYVNDMPIRRTMGGVDGGYVYDANSGHVVAVSYVRPDGRVTRVSFDRKTGEPSVFLYREDDQR